MEYVCISRQEFSFEAYRILPLRHQDLPLIKTWRNEQMDVLRQQKPLTDEDQENYWKQTLVPSFAQQQPAQLLFSYLLQDRCIGYGGLVHIDWDAGRAEMSYLVETVRYQDKKLYEKEFICFFSLLKNVAFEVLHFHRLYTETYGVRPHHMAVLEKMGFVKEGRLREHVLIQGKYADAYLHGYAA
ncbi:MAG: GNAT family N-acetyltransferase [Waddliaceae bacterium]